MAKSLGKGFTATQQTAETCVTNAQRVWSLTYVTRKCSSLAVSNPARHRVTVHRDGARVRATLAKCEAKLMIPAHRVVLKSRGEMHKMRARCDSWLRLALANTGSFRYSQRRRKLY